MIDIVWSEYRGWAALARREQARTRLWTRIGIITVNMAAILGTIAAEVPENPRLVAILSALAALTSAIFAWLGREQFVADSKSRWLKTRVVAEGMKSECYRRAALAAPYTTADGADVRFNERIAALIKITEGTGLSPIAIDPGYRNAAAAPDSSIDRDWYLEKRIGNQIAFFQKSKDKREVNLGLLRWVSFASMVAAAALGLGTAFGITANLTGWVGVVTTFSASLISLGLAGRTKALAAEAAHMVNRLNAICRAAEAESLSLADLATRTEDLLNGENERWAEIIAEEQSAKTANGIVPPN